MADRRRGTKKKDGENSEEMSKEDTAIAKYVRFNCPTETTMFQGNEVHYFSGSKAVECLYESSYGTKAKGEARFPSRVAATRFLESLLERRLFYRVKKLVPKKKEDKKANLASGDVTSSPRVKAERKKEKASKAVEDTANESEDVDDKKKEEEKEKEEDEKKKKKKVKLEVHDVQVFNDSNDVYVWIFDPTPLYKQVIGFLMVVGTIVACLFPLWPMWLRQGVYYLSMGGIGFFGAVFAFAILRTILFCIIWLATFGEHNLWLLPNLLADKGVIESFQPWYTYERASQAKKTKSGKKSKGGKEKQSDDEAEKDISPEGAGAEANEENNANISDSGTQSTSEGEKQPRRRAGKGEDDYVLVNEN